MADNQSNVTAKHSKKGWLATFWVHIVAGIAAALILTLGGKAYSEYHRGPPAPGLNLYAVGACSEKRMPHLELWNARGRAKTTDKTGALIDPGDGWTDPGTVLKAVVGEKLLQVIVGLHGIVEIPESGCNQDQAA